MDPHHGPHEADEPPRIVGRTDTGGAWSRAWPLAALALIGLILVRACVLPLPATPSAPPSSPAPSSR